MTLSPELTPRNGHTLKVLLICRVSDPKPGKQDERSLDDQEHEHREWLSRNCDLPMEVTVIAGSGSGESLDRKESFVAIDAVESAEYDLVLSEDLGRIFRRMKAYEFCELCEDSDTRLIALNDSGVDTAQADWRTAAFFAAFRHETYNRDTAKRIRRTLRSRFTQGGVFQTPIFGYIKPVGAKSDDDVYKDPDAEAIYDEWFSMLEKGAKFSTVADWLNKNDVSIGPACRNKKWDGRMVGRITRNPILKGVRVRNEMMSKRVNKTGHRKSVKAPPEDRLERPCPHLAFIDKERYDAVIELLNERNAKYRRKGENGRDTRKSIPKKRTRFPGQQIECGICGRGYVFGGHGQKNHLMCVGAREHRCWNGISVDGPLAAGKILSAVLAEIESLTDFDEAFLAAVNEEASRHDADSATEELKVAQNITRLTKERQNLVMFIRKGGDSLHLIQDLQQLEEEIEQERRNLEKLESKPRSKIQIPSVDEIRQIAHEELNNLDMDGWELQSVMKRLIPNIVVFPHRLIDGNKLVLRARFRLSLSNLLNDSRASEVLAKPMERILTVDLFDPPQREKYRRPILEMRQSDANGSKLTEKEVASNLGITITAAQRASALQRMMDQRILTDPYEAITTPPEKSKLSRHKHLRYQFDPLPHAGEF